MFQICCSVISARLSLPYLKLFGMVNLGSSGKPELESIIFCHCSKVFFLDVLHIKNNLTNYELQLTLNFSQKILNLDPTNKFNG